MYDKKSDFQKGWIGTDIFNQHKNFIKKHVRKNEIIYQTSPAQYLFFSLELL